MRRNRREGALGTWYRPAVLARAYFPYVFVCGGLFTAVAVIGAVVVQNGGDPALAIAWEVPAGPDRGFRFFFDNNFGVFLVAALGFPLLALPPVWILLLNAYVFGSVVAGAVERFGLLTAVLLVAPHGIFELPAILLGIGVGVRWSHWLWRLTVGRPPRTTALEHVGQTLLAVLFGAALLAAAALIEAELTPAIVRAVS